MNDGNTAVPDIETIRNLVDRIGAMRDDRDDTFSLEGGEMKMIQDMARAYAAMRGIPEALRTHTLKTDPEPFEDTWNYKKVYEYRFDDRGYQIGDTLILRETNPNYEGDNEYSGRRIEATVKHILRGSYGLPAGYIIMGIVIGARSTGGE